LQGTETLLVLLSVQFTASKPFLQQPERLLLSGIHPVGECPQEQDSTSHNKGNKKECATKYRPQQSPHHAAVHHPARHIHALCKHLLHILFLLSLCELSAYRRHA
jgi:hypothetical protein